MITIFGISQFKISGTSLLISINNALFVIYHFKISGSSLLIPINSVMFANLFSFNYFLENLIGGTLAKIFSAII